MTDTFIFSGTSEGRILAERLAGEGISCDVFVATNYGLEVMDEMQGVSIHVGRLGLAELVELFNENSPKLVVDATHPHAFIVTENIKKALEESRCSAKYIRLKRKLEQMQEGIVTKNAAEAAEALLNLEGNILLTTGVKELKTFMEKEPLAERIYARILPSIDSLTLAMQTGIKPKHIVAMEGPFSESMNIALIKEHDIKVLVTKNSGAKGGYQEKLSAAAKTGTKVIVIEPEVTDNGLSLSEVSSLLTGRSYEEEVKKENIEISLVGGGLCDERTLTLAGKSAIESAEVILGAERMALFGAELNPSAKIYKEYKNDSIIQCISSELQNGCTKFAVIYSGDTGFYSGTKGLLKSLKTAEFASLAKVTVIPGISSLSYFASRIMVDYSGAELISLHGIEQDILGAYKRSGKVFSLLTDSDDIARVCRMLKGEAATVYAGYNLGSSEEEISTFRASDCPEFTKKGLYVLCIKGDNIE